MSPEFAPRLSGMFDERISQGSRLFFVQGLWRSGTTWLGQMLNSVPDVYVCGHELHSYTRGIQVTQSGRPIAEHPFLGERYAAARKAAFLSMLMHFHRTEKPGARLIGERSPGGDVRLMQNEFPGARTIIMLRDGRDICVSSAYLGVKTGADPWCVDEATGCPAMRHVIWSALAYSVNVPEYLALGAAHPDKVLLVRYEDLLANPQAVMSKAFAFVGVDVPDARIDEICREHAFANAQGQATSQNDKRFWMRKGKAGSWKENLRGEAVEVYEAIAGATLERAGYARSAAPATRAFPINSWIPLYTAQRLLRSIESDLETSVARPWRSLLSLSGALVNIVEWAAFRRLTNLTKLNAEIRQLETREPRRP